MSPSSPVKNKKPDLKKAVKSGAASGSKMGAVVQKAGKEQEVQYTDDKGIARVVGRLRRAPTGFTVALDCHISELQAMVRGVCFCNPSLKERNSKRVVQFVVKGGDASPTRVVQQMEITPPLIDMSTGGTVIGFKGTKQLEIFGMSKLSRADYPGALLRIVPSEGLRRTDTEPPGESEDPSSTGEPCIPLTIVTKHQVTAQGDPRKLFVDGKIDMGELLDDGQQGTLAWQVTDNKQAATAANIMKVLKSLVVVQTPENKQFFKSVKDKDKKVPPTLNLTFNDPTSGASQSTQLSLVQ